MNKKLIDRLVQEAGIYATLEYKLPKRSKESGKIWEDGHVEWSTLFNKHLVDLIVQECIVVAYAQRNPSNLDYSPIERFATDLKQHFGIKDAPKT